MFTYPVSSFLQTSPVSCKETSVLLIKTIKIVWNIIFLIIIAVKYELMITGNTKKNHNDKEEFN